MVDAVAIAATQNGSATRKPSLGEALVRARYKYIPDHVLGEILTKRWIDNVGKIADGNIFWLFNSLHSRLIGLLCESGARKRDYRNH